MKYPKGTLLENKHNKLRTIVIGCCDDVVHLSSTWTKEEADKATIGKSIIESRQKVYGESRHVSEIDINCIIIK